MMRSDVSAAPEAPYSTLKISDARSMIRLQVAYVPEGFVENVGDELGMVSRCVQDDLKRFKEFIEQRGRKTGAWRGSDRQ